MSTLSWVSNLIINFRVNLSRSPLLLSRAVYHIMPLCLSLPSLFYQSVAFAFPSLY